MKFQTSVVVILVLAYASLLACWTLSGQPLDDHEAFVSVTARNMIESGNWVIPNFNGELRIKKTPLPYWLVVFTAKVTGTVDEFTARFPSAVFALASAATLLFFMTRWFDFRTAVLSTLIWSSTLGYMRFAHSARPEMACTFFTMLAMLAFFSAITAQNRRQQVIYALLFWAAFALGNLAKGPAPLPLVIPPIILYVIIFKEWNKLLKLLPIVGPLLFLAILLPWPLTIIFTEPTWQFIWKQQYVDRFVGDMGSSDRPFYYYGQIMFELVAPWVAFLPLALVAPFFKIWDRKRRPMLYLWLWFVADIIVMSCATGKRRHYILPAMPAAAVLIGVILEDLVFSLKANPRDFARKFIAGHIIFFVAAFVALPVITYNRYNEFFPAVLSVSVIGLAWMLALTITSLMNKKFLACAVAFAGFAVIITFAYSRIFNLDPAEYSVRETALRLKQIIPPDDTVRAYYSLPARFVHYFGRSAPMIQKKAQIKQLYDKGDWILVDAKRLPSVADPNYVQAFYEKIFKYDRKEAIALYVFHKP